MERHRGFPDIDHRKIFRLARHPLLRLYLYWLAQWSRTNACQRLHAYRIHCVGYELWYCSQLIVIHNLWVPRGHWLIWIGRIIHLVSLKWSQKNIFYVKYAWVLVMVNWAFYDFSRGHIFFFFFFLQFYYRHLAIWRFRFFPLYNHGTWTQRANLKFARRWTWSWKEKLIYFLIEIFFVDEKLFVPG